MDWFIDYMIAIKLTKLYVTNFKISTVILHIAGNIRSHLRSRIKNQVFGGHLMLYFVSYTMLQIRSSNHFLTCINKENQGIHSCTCKNAPEMILEVLLDWS